MFQNFISQYLATTGYLEFQPKAVMFDMDGVIYDSMPTMPAVGTPPCSQ